MLSGTKKQNVSKSKSSEIHGAFLKWEILNKIKSLNEKEGLLGFLWQENKSEPFKACTDWELRWFMAKAKTYRSEERYSTDSFRVIFCSRCLGFPNAGI